MPDVEPVRGASNNLEAVLESGPCISDLDQVSTPQLFYAYFYNHARRLRLEKLLYLELSRSPTGFLNHFWTQIAVSLLKPPNGGFRIETAGVRSGVTAV
jgi:hypothetical protein